MKLNVINNGHGADSKAWYTLKPLQKYMDVQGIPTMWGLGVGNYDRCLNLKNNKQPWLFCDMPYWNRYHLFVRHFADHWRWNELLNTCC